MAESGEQSQTHRVLSSLSLHQLEIILGMMSLEHRADAWHSYAEYYEDNDSQPARWDRAIYCYRKAVEFADEETKPTFLSHLSLALLARADGGLSPLIDTQLAVEAAMEATRIVKLDNLYLRMFKANYGEAMFRLYELSGDPDDFDAGHDAVWGAICLVDDEGDPLIQQWYGKLRQETFRRAMATNASSDIDKALKLFGADTPNFQDDVDLQYYYATLLLTRHLVSHSTVDLMQCGQTVDSLLRSDSEDANYGSLLSLQGHYYLSMARRARDAKYCDEAIICWDRSMVWFEDHAHLNSRERAALLGSKASTLVCRYDLSGQDGKENESVPDADLDHAITLARQAVHLSSANAADEFNKTANLLGILGSALSCRYSTKLPIVADLDEAISTFTTALKYQDKFFHAQTLANLGKCLRYRAEATGSMTDWNSAIQAYEDGAACLESPVYYRICAADDGGNFIYQQDPARALRLFETATKLLPLLSPASLSQSDRERNLIHFDLIAWSATSACLEVSGDVYKAIRLSELGRWTLADLRLNLDADTNMLKEEHEKLAEEFAKIRSELRSNVRSFENSLTNAPTNVPDFRTNLEKFNAILAEIRGKRGFETFLECPTERELLAMAQPGPLVMFSVTKFRSDALLITKTGLKSIALSKLAYSDALDNAQKLIDIVSTQSVKLYAQNSKALKKILAWLWDTVVNPVLEELGYTAMITTSDEWPQVWWIRCGLLSHFPLHAAGHHDTDPRISTIDRVVSSYTPTIKSLLHARRPVASEFDRTQKVVILGMPSTPSQDDLPAVIHEVAALNDTFSSGPATTVKMSPTHDQAVDLLSSANIFHFSGHGLSSPEDPLLSCLLTQDWQTKPLTILRLLNLDSFGGQFAYLSVCHSGGSPNSGLILLDESLHISSAFQLIGYRGVVATLWYCFQYHSKTVALRLYKHMLNECNTVCPERAALGLHLAVRQLRDELRKVTGSRRLKPDDPLTWAAYIHTGA